MKGNNFKAGVASGLFSGITWGLDTVIVGIILGMGLFTQNDKVIFLAPFVATFLRDGFSAIWMSIGMILKGDFKKVIKGLRTRSGLFVAIGALLGGPVGMTCYMFSLRYIGPAYTANISAIYPGIAAALAFVFLKEKVHRRAWVGIILSVIGVFVLGFSTGGGENGGNFTVGILFALGTVIGWASESVICAYGMKEDISPYEALNIRQFVSGSVYGLVILPLMGAHFLTGQVAFSGVGGMLALSALIGTTSYLLWYRAIYMIGAARSTALNITYAVWTIVFQKLILNTEITSQLIIGSIIILTGAILVSGNPKEMLRVEENPA